MTTDDGRMTPDDGRMTPDDGRMTSDDGRMTPDDDGDDMEHRRERKVKNRTKAHSITLTKFHRIHFNKHRTYSQLPSF